MNSTATSASAAKLRRLLAALNAAEAGIHGLHAMLAVAKEHNMGPHMDRLTAEIAEFENDAEMQRDELLSLGYCPAQV